MPDDRLPLDAHDIHDTQPPQRLGAALRTRNLITEGQLEQALAQQSSGGGRLGEIIGTICRLSPWHLYEILSKQSRRPLINLNKYPPAPDLVNIESVYHYVEHDYIPWKQVDGHLIIACADPSPAMQQWAAKHYKMPVECVLATPRDIKETIEQLFGRELEHKSRTRLLREAPDFSASYTAEPKQMLCMLALFAMIMGLLLFDLESTAIGILLAVNLLYLSTLGLKFLLFLNYKKGIPPQTDISRLDENTLPVYTILIPMYQEIVSVPRILNAIRALDYPKTKLDVKLIVESDDTLTIEAIKDAHPESYFELIRVPYCEPRTKPRACSYALNFVRGELVTIYDAEDRPEPQQLKKAVARFRSLPADVVCLQARLNYYNWQENLLTKLFAIEYSALFDCLLPGLKALGIPIPLGGTSNHIHYQRLREIKDWDPYNVTEDADLGMRLALYGYRTDMLDSITLEEAPVSLGAWIKQRSRWIKGYMQTWFVYMRQPALLHQSISGMGFWGFQLFIGAPCLVFLLTPFLWLFAGLWFAGYIPVTLPGWLMMACLMSFIAGLACHLWFAVFAIQRWRWPHMDSAIMLFPFYWLLHSVASIRALWQLLFRPHYWEKTEHAQSCYTQRDISASIRNI